MLIPRLVVRTALACRRGGAVSYKKVLAVLSGHGGGGGSSCGMPSSLAVGPSPRTITTAVNDDRHHDRRHSRRRSLRTSSSNWNEDNMLNHHMPHDQPPQEWDTFHGKLSVLKEKSRNQQSQQQKSQGQHIPNQNERFRQRVLSQSGDDIHGRTLVQSGSGNNKGEWQLYGEHPRTSLLMELTDRVGVLHDVLRFFWKYDLNVCRIESRPVKVSKSGKNSFDFFIDFEGSIEDPNVIKLLDALGPMTTKLLILDEKSVHWFPRHISELDLIADRTLDAGTDLESDHPGFHDIVYRARRAELAESATNHRWDKPIQRIDYTPEENAVWGVVWDKMEGLWDKYACKEYLHSLELMKAHCGYDRNRIPQQQDISEFLQTHTNFQMRPVAGLLSSRDFLNGLAYRVFFSTQYIRHHSKPLYTPEPDICHELLGHAPMFADRDFADFSQEIGLASLGASDEDVQKLAHCYWHSVEFGLCKEHGDFKAYGAGLLSSFGELEYACSSEHPGADKPPEILPWDPEVAARQVFPITTYQPVYFVAESLQDAKQKMRQFCEDLPRPFFAFHNPQTDTVYIDRPVKRTKGIIPETETAAA